MIIRMRLYLALAFLAPVAFCVPGEPLIPFDSKNTLPNALIRIKKHHGEDPEYLEQCGIVDAWMEQPGLVNVLAFLDASWQFSHRQATMLKLLQGRLERTGIKDIRFFVVNSAQAGALADKYEVQDEIEAWTGAPQIEAESFAETEQSIQALKNAAGPEISVVQDNEKLRLWERLHGSRDQVLVIDRCGRLSYQVIVPWSILHFPYVKAAILSTYKDHPCGECDLQPVTESPITENRTEQLPEHLPNKYNITEMKELAGQKYNLDQSLNDRTKPHKHKQFEDMPEHIMKLLNETVGIKHERQQLDSEKNGSRQNVTEMATGGAIFDNGYINTYGDYTTELNGTETQVNNANRAIADNVTDITKLHADALSENVTETFTIKEMENNSFIRENMKNTGRQYFNNTESFMDNFNSTNSNEQVSNSRYGNKNENYLRNNMQNGKESQDNSNYGNESNGQKSFDAFNTADKKNNDSGITENAHITEFRPDGDSNTDTTTNLSSLEDNDENHISRSAGPAGEDGSREHSENADYVMPLRIIMHAPHLHEYGYLVRKHEYLVLRTDQPEYHGHLNSSEIMTSADDMFGPSDENNHDDKKDDDRENNEAEVYEVDDNDEERGHRHAHSKKFTNDHKGRHHHVHSKPHKKKHDGHVFGKDESPGFYGEDADYWRNYGNEESYERSGEVQPNANEHYIKIGKKGKQTEYDIEKLHGDDGKSSIRVDTDSNGEITNVEVEKESIIERIEGRKNIAKMRGQVVESVEEVVQGRELVVDGQSGEDGAREEEMKNKIIAHYSKLLPWIYYVLNE